jgi:hypothetical protein
MGYQCRFYTYHEKTDRRSIWFSYLLNHGNVMMGKRIKTKDLALGGLFLALGVIVPQIFHFFGAAAGRMFLPMHIPVMLAGFFVGPVIGLLAGILSPVLSSLITGMPPVPMLYFMMFELGAYGFSAGILFRKYKLNAYFSLILSMLSGRLVYGLVLLTAVHILGISSLSNISVIGATITGLPGLAIQLVFIPAVVYLVERRLKLGRD